MFVQLEVVSAQKAVDEERLKLATTVGVWWVTNKKVDASEGARRGVEKANLPDSKVEAVRHRIRRSLHGKSSEIRARLLSQEAENFLVKLCVAFEALVNPLGTQDLQLLAKIIGRLEHLPTSGWVGHFRKIHAKEIKIRKGKHSHKRKILMAGFPSVCAWVEETEKTLEKVIQEESLVFNLDETRAIPASKVKQLLSSTKVKETQYYEAIDETLYTMVSCIAADGSVHFLLYLLRQTGYGDSLNQSLYIPQIAEHRPTRNRQTYPVYVAVAPKGYMNGIVWKATMEIFRDLVLPRQGIGHEKQALLYLDGCSSHLKDWTSEELEKFNVKVIWFPSNTSHILQPLDGECFATYKNKARQESLSEAMGVSLGALRQNERALYTSLKAHENSMTEKVIKASFRNRGIFPWDPARALANARSATLLDTFLPAEQETCDLFYARLVISELSEKLKPDTKLQRKMIQSVNTPEKLQTLKDWSRKPPKKKSKLAEPQPLSIPSIPIVESNDINMREESSDDEEAMLILPPIRRFPSGLTCSHCGHERSIGKLPSACIDCDQYWLCRPCATNTNALALHQETHSDLEGRRSRRRR